jgi:hypothetical protein
MLRGCATRQPSPKKSVGFNIAIVASLPALETTVSLTLPFWIENSASTFCALRVNSPLLSHAQKCSTVTPVGEELVHVKFDIFRWHRAKTPTFYVLPVSLSVSYEAYFKICPVQPKGLCVGHQLQQRIGARFGNHCKDAWRASSSILT